MKKFLLLALAVCAVLPAYAQDKKNNYSIAYETSSYGYKEPLDMHHMELKGRMSGVVFDYISRSAFTAKEVDANDPSFFAIQLRYLQGDVNYDGWLVSNTTPRIYIKEYTPSVSDYYLEGRLTAGSVYDVGSALELWPYVGIAGRYLVDKQYEKSPYGYRRTSTYIYAPIGAKAKVKLPAQWSVSLSGEYDIFIYGKQLSRLSDTNPSDEDLRNDQGQGYGARASFQLAKDFKHVGFFVEPFFRYWHIKRSDIYITDAGDAYVEPNNETHESGVKIGITF